MDRKTKIQKLNSQIRRCRRCRLYKSASRAVPGEGPLNAKIMFIGLSPGKEEDRTGRPFVGRSGKLLDSLLEKNKIDRKKVFITSTVKHHPPGNRPLRADEIRACFPYAIEQAYIIKPETIVLLGSTAKKTFARSPFLKGRKIICTCHPAAALRFTKMRKKIEQDFRKIR